VLLFSLFYTASIDIQEKQCCLFFSFALSARVELQGASGHSENALVSGIAADEARGMNKNAAWYTGFRA
jgi:hypothetical protein